MVLVKDDMNIELKQLIVMLGEDLLLILPINMCQIEYKQQIKITNVIVP